MSKDHVVIQTRNGYYVSKDVTLYYELNGRGVEKVLFCHGFGGSMNDYSYCIQRFVSYPCFETCNFSLRGVGLSQTNDQSQSTSTFADDILHLVTHLGWDKSKFHLIGFSMGGMICLRFSVDHYKLLKTITLLSGSPNHFHPTGGAVLNVTKFLNPFADERGLLLEEINHGRRYLLNSTPDISKFKLPKLSSSSSSSFTSPDSKDNLCPCGCDNPTRLAQTIPPKNKPQVPSTPAKASMSHTLAVIGHNVKTKEMEVLAAQNIPTLVMYGGQDKMVSPADSREIGKALHAQMHCFEDCGHLTIFEEPEGLARRILHFLFEALGVVFKTGVGEAGESYWGDKEIAEQEERDEERKVEEMREEHEKTLLLARSRDGDGEGDGGGGGKQLEAVESEKKKKKSSEESKSECSDGYLKVRIKVKGRGRKRLFREKR